MRSHWHLVAILLTALLSGGNAQALQSSTNDGIDAGTTAETLASAVSHCATAPGIVRIATPIDISGPLKIPASCVLSFQPGGALKGTGSIVIPGEVLAPQSLHIFQQPLSVTGLSAATSSSGSIPVEWFGAVSTAFAACPTAPDATDVIQAAINSLSAAGNIRLAPGCYHTTHVLSITRSTIGIKGAGQGLTAIDVPGASVLLSTSPSADILDVTGTKEHYLVWNNLEDFALERAVNATGDAAGLAVNFAGGLHVSRLWSYDSIRDFYLHGVPDYGLGVWRDVVATWRVSNTTPKTGTLYGWYFDSADGVGMNSFKGDHLSCGNDRGPGPTTYCYYLTGTTVKDVDLDSANVAGASYGLYVNYTGHGEQDSSADIHINMPTMDDCYISCIYVKGLHPDGGASLTVNAGYLDSNTANSKVVDIEDSYGVAITNNQIFAMGSSGGSTGIYASNSASLSIQQNKFQQIATGTAVQLTHTIGSAITGNTLLASPKQPLTTGITLENASTGNAISGNVTLGNIETAYRFDDTSSANDFAANSCAPSNIKHCLAGKPKPTSPQK